jgi:hypothetical protein
MISRSRYPAPPAMSATSAALEADASAEGVRSPAIGAPMALRLKVFLTRGKLDRKLAVGGSYETTDALALRVRQLTDPSKRRQIARELRGVVEYVDNRKSGAVISSVVIEPAAVRAGRETILGLAERIEATEYPVSARGVVLARALLTDGSSPLYNPHSERTVSEAVFDVQDALGGPPAPGFDAAAA